MSGCEAVQVNERMFVQMMGLRERGGIYELTVQISSGDGIDGDGHHKLLTGRGRSFSEAAESICRENGRELFFGHCQLIFTDESILRYPERLKNLLGNRVSVGCPVVYSSSPEMLAAGGDENVEPFGADDVNAMLRRYSDDGVLTVTTLKTVCEKAESGSFAAVPSYDAALNGSAVLSGSKLSKLDLAESAAYNVINGGKNISMTVLGGKAELDGIDRSVYYQQSEDGGEYQVKITADCTVTELGSTSDLSEYRRETAKLLTEETESFLRRAYKEEFLSAVNNFENVRYGEQNVTFSVIAEITLK